LILRFKHSEKGREIGSGCRTFRRVERRLRFRVCCRGFVDKGSVWLIAGNMMQRRLWMLHTSLLLGVVIITLLALSQNAVARTASAPVDHAASDSVNAFACDLYNRIASEHASDNVFFSPFSMTSALAMTAEGARGQTADEMGRVLHVPQASHTRDADRPWDLSKLHQAMGALSDRLGEKPAPKELTDRIATLRKELAADNEKLKNDHSYDDSTENLQRKAQKLAAELNDLQSKVDQYEFRAANALWGEKTFDFQKAFLDTIAKYYKAGGLFPVDFQTDPEGSRKHINDWVSQQTNDRIKDLIAPKQITPDTRLVLTNAVYFKGEWADPFKEAETKDEDFTTLDGGKPRMKLMHNSAPKGAKYAAFNADGSLFATPEMVSTRERHGNANLYPAGDGFLIAELPYKGGDLSMIVLLPQTPGAMKNLESKLSAENLFTWTGKLKTRKVDVFLPKFKLETGYEMTKPLEALGMKRAFANPIEADGAQFDGISPSSDPRKRLFISAVIHKAFVDVNEKGTEAAAATAILMAAGSAMPMSVPFVPTFRADKPFLFLIRENATGTVPFMGRVTKPS
jgi:serine protease inhibitor